MMSPIPEEWEHAYREWLVAHQEALEARDWGRAFAGYPWVRGSEPALTPLGRPLSAARIAVISSGGVSATGEPPFDAQDPLGDASYRIVRGALGPWEVHHGHYDTGPAKDDYNVVFPLVPLQQLVQRGVIGAVSDINFTFMGYQPDPRPFYKVAAPGMLQDLQAHEVDGVLLVPG